MDCRKIYDEAYQAGMKALNGCVPTPMIVAQHSNMMDDNSPIKKSYFVEGGVCGFAWTHISPARGKFVNWLKSKDIGHKSYYGGYDVSVREGGQSMERKIAFADAFSDVLMKYGIKCYSDSRMD